jgi:hypothetical protein
VSVKLKIADDEPADVTDWIMHSDDVIIACRGQGHSWPKIRPGKLPRGMKAIPQHDGGYELVTTCRDCGMVRRLITLPSGMIDMPAKYSYVQPDGYKAPKGSKVTRRECLAESWRRMREEIAKEILAAQRK